MTLITSQGAAANEPAQSEDRARKSDTLTEITLGPAMEGSLACTVLDAPCVAIGQSLAYQKALHAATTVHVHGGTELAQHLSRLEAYVARGREVPLSRHPAWPLVLAKGLKQVPYCLEAQADGQTRGVLCLAYVRSLLFGRFLVGLPYLNYGGVLADDELVARQLIGRAVELADQLKVRYLELRHERGIEHPLLQHKLSTKVNMRLALPATSDELWKGLSSKVRNQVRKAEKHDFQIAWGGRELLDEFYHVFSHNMRDLGTPVYSRKLFRAMLDQFPDRAEVCSVRLDGKPIASALLLHGWNVTEVPSASSLREHNHTCANMLLYWHLLKRAMLRKQNVFDFGRCSPDGNTFKFKKQWGSEPAYTEWQYYLRSGNVGEMNPYNPRYQRYVERWQRLPVWLTRLVGPSIVRGIP